MKIKPVNPGGFRDYSPEEMIFREEVLAAIKAVYEKYGFVPLDTPCVELAEVLLGENKEIDKQIFYLRLADEEDRLTLRYDLTVPLARYVAANLDNLTLPFKRYQIGEVFRGEKPQAGRYRQFKQFDADIIGSSSMMADAEIIMMMAEALSSLKIKKFIIKINNRKVLDGLAKKNGLKNDEIAKKFFRTLDKLSKIGEEEIKNFFKEELKMSQLTCEEIINFLKIDGKDLEKIEKAKTVLSGGKIGEEGLRELTDLIRYLQSMGVSSDLYQLDFSIARGLDYYTGTVFEAYLLDLPQIGSVMSGGRFDDLISRFSPRDLPAVGASIGLDRLFAAMEKLKIVQPSPVLTEVMVTNLEKDQESLYLSLVANLRREGIKTEIYFGKEESLRGQIGYANRKRIPIVIIIGENERKKEEALIKDMRFGKQEPALLKEIIEAIKERLKK